MAWLAAAADMHREYPDDDEVTLQYALALLSNCTEDDGHVREQMEAGAFGLQVLQHRPQHPGAAHYVIHAFDSPDHAILALPAARLYARIAPAGSHALHMPSHVFTQLGMWREVVPSNEQAFAASVAWEKSRGHTPSEYDWHSYSWLVAAHLELGQRAAARKLTLEAGALLVASRDDSSDLRDNYLSMVTNYVAQTGRWGELEAMMAPVLAPAFDEGSTPDERSVAGHAVHVACAMHAPGGKPLSDRPHRPGGRGLLPGRDGHPARRRGDGHRARRGRKGAPGADGALEEGDVGRLREGLERAWRPVARPCTRGHEALRRRAEEAARGVRDVPQGAPRWQRVRAGDGADHARAVRRDAAGGRRAEGGARAVRDGPRRATEPSALAPRRSPSAIRRRRERITARSRSCGRTPTQICRSSPR